MNKELTEREVLEWCEARNYVLVDKEVVPYLFDEVYKQYKRKTAMKSTEVPWWMKGE